MHLYDVLMANDDLASHGFGMSRSLNETQIGSTSWSCRLCPTAISLRRTLGLILCPIRIESFQIFFGLPLPQYFPSIQQC